MSGVIRRRPHLVWLLVPYALYLGAMPFVNRVTPLVFGVPFLFAWLLGATLLTPVAVWLARRADRRGRTGDRRGRTGDRPGGQERRPGGRDDRPGGHDGPDARRRRELP